MRSRVFWLLFLLSLLTASHGAYLNDSRDQAAGLHALSEGSLRLSDGYGHLYYQGGNLSQQERRTDGVPVGSTVLNVVALPMDLALRGVDHVIPFAVLLAFLVPVALAKTLSVSPWNDRLRDGHQLALLFLLAAVGYFLTGRLSKTPDLDLWHPFIALQATNIALFLLAAWRFHKLLSRHVDLRWAHIVTLATFAGSLLFWAPTMKYHVLSALLVVLMLEVSERTGPRARILLGILAGLAFATNLGSGAVAVVAVGAWTTWRVLRKRWPAAAMWHVPAGGLVGMLPFFIENLLLFGNPLTSFYQVPQGTNATVGAERTGWFAQYALGWESPLAWLEGISSVFVTGIAVEGSPLGVFHIQPLLIAAVVGSWLGRRHASARLAALLLLLQAIVMLRPSLLQGDGVDVRLWTNVLPAMGLLAGLALAKARAPSPKGVAAWAIGSLTLAVAFLALLDLLDVGYTDQHSKGEHIRTYLNLIGIFWGLVALMGLVLWRTLMGDRDRSTWMAGTAIGVTAVWVFTFMILSHTGLSPYQGDEEHTHWLDGVGQASDWMFYRLLPEYPLPIVYNEDGSLAFHPDHGRCDDPGVSCPDP